MKRVALFLVAGVVLFSHGSAGAHASADYVRMSTSSGKCLWWPGNELFKWTPSDKLEAVIPGSLASIQRAFDVWQAQMDACGSLHFSRQEATASTHTGQRSRDAKENLIIARKDSCQKTVSSADPCWQNNNCGGTYNCWQYDDAALAITLTTFISGTGQLLDADVEINSNYTYAVDKTPPCRSCFFEDLDAVMVHEIGHMLGLGHSNKPGSVMYPTLSSGIKETHALDLDSAQFVCDVYPKGLSSRDCNSDGGGATSSFVTEKSSGCSASLASEHWVLFLGVLWLLPRIRRGVARA